ncbi:glycosyltransferase [Microcoleus sp. bin38.metabat.b11b12b14.051]|uniref:glycosyltransferase n=1 Tax=Microcoleus sp. bin38.metabat.b11b12b14.051 TaxID=2742709 RepID=UPI0025CE90D5|nr:glycosyltransferase [Microcoleus sp. bin38.metabat.b11b12b14.051]
MNNQEFLPIVSVVVPVYNGETDLPELIECLRSQTYPTTRVEYLLVDNKSRDRTSTILETLSSPNPPSVPPLSRGGSKQSQITIRNLSENTIQSSYAARNKGIRASTGEIIAFTDADCRPESQWLENLVKPFADLEIGITCGEILALPGNSLLEKHAARENTLSQKHTLAHPFCAYGQTANLAVRREILARVGLFRPYLTSGGDADLCWRILRETSYQIYFAEKAIVRHRHRSTIKQLQSQWHRYGESNKYLHQLHGVDLMREFTTGEYLYRLARWLLKELPVAATKCTLAKPSKRIARADLVDLLNTPIGLLNVRARAIGQRQAQLPELAREIERL